MHKKRSHPFWRAIGVTAVLLVSPPALWAKSVAMSGSMGSMALLVIDGSPPKALRAGQTHQGVTVVSVASDQAVVSVDGKRFTVVMGGAPVSAGGGARSSGGDHIVLPASAGGHFIAQGSINGRAAEFMVDTGATTIAMGLADAKRLGIDYEKGTRTVGSTANGLVQAYKVRLASVRIQDVEVHDVEAAVLPQAMPHILLGNSFLSRFQMNTNNEQLTLKRRY
jgi:aspartyl protease family protein